jgi:hypothetical protein
VIWGYAGQQRWRVAKSIFQNLKLTWINCEYLLE